MLNDPHYRPAGNRRRPEKRGLNGRKKLRKLAAFLLAVFVLGFGTHVALARAADAHHQAELKQIAAETSARKQRVAALDAQIQAVFAQYPGITFSVSFVDLHDNSTKHLGSDQDFIAASTGKMITATDFLYQVQQGKQSLGETIDGDSAQDLLEKMIVDSDNDAWASLNDTLTHASLKNYTATQIGFTDYDPDDNTLNSNDMALLLQKLYEGDLLNHTNTQLLLGYMKRANYRQFAVPAVPSEDIIYHKIGVLDDLVHDATIITHGKDAFVMAIYTDGNGDYSWDTRATAIQAVTKLAIKAYLNN